MKIQFILFAFLFTAFFFSCDEYKGNTYDFSNSIPNYVEFKSVDEISVKPGAEASFNILTKSCFFKDTQISVKIEGATLNETKTIVLPKMKTTVDGNFTIPATAAIGSNFTITIISAQTDGAEIRLGRINSKKTVLKGVVEEED